jgi:endonuclease/exonuclease/phosphatase family metal-dependent hydrolase
MTMLRIASFNIRHGLGRDGILSLERTAAVIRATRATVIGVQEVDRFWDRSAGLDQSEELARLSGMHVIFSPTFTRGRSEYGIALVAEEPLDTEFHALPRRAGEEPRGLISARVDGLSILVTHLSQDAGARRRQIEAVLDIAEAAPPPVVILGDFNETRRGLKAFDAAGFSPGPLRAPTFPRPGLLWDRQIDFVFAGRGARVVGSKTLRTPASDHLPLVADVAL